MYGIPFTFSYNYPIVSGEVVLLVSTAELIQQIILICTGDLLHQSDLEGQRQRQVRVQHADRAVEGADRIRQPHRGPSRAGQRAGPGRVVHLLRHKQLICVYGTDSPTPSREGTMSGFL